MKLRGLLITSLLVAAIAWWQWSLGSPVQTKIHAALREGRQVTVVVHSTRGDYGWDETAMKNFKEEIFQTVELSSEQKELLRQALPRAKDSGDSLKCMFVPHHRIEIVMGDGSRLDWEICFQCGEHVFAGDRKRILPGGWRESISGFFRSQKIRTEIPEKIGGGDDAAPTEAR